MKKRCLFLLGFFLTVFASGCAVTLPFHKSESTSVSSSEDLSADDESNVEFIPGGTQPPSDTPLGNASEENGLENASTDDLVKYDSIYDIPFVSLDFTDNGNCLTKNGQPWVSAPGTQKFGNLCFSDGKTLYIQCFLSDNPDDGFRWFWVCFDNCHKNSSTFLPEETNNQLFTHANGYTLYTDDGYEYALAPCKELPCSEGGSTQTSDIKDEPYLSSQDLQVPVPDFLTDEQKLLYLRAYKMMLIRIGTYAIDDTQYFPCDRPDTTRTYTDTISVDGYEYTPALNRYRQWDSLYSTLRSIFTESFLNSNYLSSDGVTYFRSIEGNMYYISTERGFDPGYNQDSTLMDFSLQEDTADRIVIQVTATYAIDESSSQAFRQAVLDGLISNTKNYSITLVRGDDGWRFSQFDVPY